ncbi:MAG: hypothetical protein HY247_02310 [archaeon]|nr:MAG: hypothetical protein HY247_02310 [archaeon]
MRTPRVSAFRIDAPTTPEKAKEHFPSGDSAVILQALSLASAQNLGFVRMIAAQTVKARARGILLARKPEVDLLLRFAGTTQIKEAIRVAGAATGKPFLLVVIGQAGALKGAGSIGKELPNRPLTKEELLRVERAALLNAQRS